MRRNLIIAILALSALVATVHIGRAYLIDSHNEDSVKIDKVYALEKEPVKTEIKALSVEELIIIECDKYGVDEELALAIAKLETGHFTSDAYTAGNNVGGMSIDEEPMCFPSLERGVEAFVKNLYYNYYEQGLDTVDEIAKKYCPLNQEQWAETVKELMN
jgi:hypothetical protein